MKSKSVVGKISVNQRGFGFVTPEDGGTDIFVAAENLRGAFNGDTVKVRITNIFRGRLEGHVTEILEHATEIVVGKLTHFGKKVAVEPDDKRINREIILPGQKFLPNTKVVVKVTSWEPLRGKVVEVLGKANGVGVEIRGILRSHGVEEKFPPEVQAEASRVETEPGQKEIARRIDRRNLKIVTIDGEDAKDLDDGVFAEERDGGFFLGVYIADVSYYVRPKTFLDGEAFERGTSIYPVDRVVPMLPVELSNGICSLNAGVNRLAFACEMILDSSGNVTSHKIFPTVIKVFRRLSYTQVNKFLDGDNELADCADNLNALKKIHGLRKKFRDERGSIDFDLPEMKIILDANGRPIEITKRIQTVAESIIEECMLLANETVARHTVTKKIPSLYRVHELPSPDKVQTLNQLLSTFGLHVTKSASRELEPRDFQKILSKVKGRPVEKVITGYTLRTMQQARYAAENLGHFGIAAKFYTHFTSPIRRYPDLIVHRMLRASLETPDKLPTLAKKLDEAAKHSSERERRAIEVERETLDLKAAEFMSSYVGEIFDGVIDGVTNFGFFVELENGVDGLVRVASLYDDFYEFVENKFALIGQSTGKSFRIGDKVRVKLSSVNTKLRQINFELI
ncbi:MAG: ribonuclease R [Selenomonadaceae bacterium]|nr:ribonuclease R [Selenomonadaceae bacterium]